MTAADRLAAIRADLASAKPYARIETAGRFYAGYYADDADVKRTFIAAGRMAKALDDVLALASTANRSAARGQYGYVLANEAIAVIADALAEDA